jgi:UDP-GlcNAc:undecaprenyl-phosphate GlcNAc-1-phosphate transferase
MMFWAALSALAVSFFLSAMATSLAKRVSVRLNMLDVPGRHKAHGEPTPLLGGTAIFATIAGLSVFGLALARIWAATSPPEFLRDVLAIHIPGAARRAPQGLGILAGAAILHVLGLIDDKRGLGPWLKLLVQVLVAAGVVVFFDVRVAHHWGTAVSVILTTLWIVAITNSFNFLDNMDGLAAGVGAIAGFALLAAAAGMGQVFVPAWLCVLVGALLGFLVHNFPPARIFMGDAGSLVVGYLLAVLSCLTTYTTGRQDAVEILYGVLAPVLMMAIPLYDTLSVMVIRISEGRNPMIGDTRHFSHRLRRRGMSKRRTVLTIYLCTATTAMAASLLPHVESVLAAVMLVAQVVFILLIIALLESAER